MAVKYAIAKLKVGFGKEKTEAYAGRVQLGETVDTDMLVEQVSLRTGMTQAQVKMALENLTDSIKHFCKMGNGVRVGRLGIIKPGIKTRSSEKEGDVEVESLHYNYIPSVEMKNALRELEVRKLGDSSNHEEEEEEEEEPDNGGNNGGGSGTGGGGQVLS